MKELKNEEDKKKKGRPVARIRVNCENCGKEIVKHLSVYNKSKTKRFFCDKECQAQTGAKPRKGNYFKCRWCNEEFYRRPSESRSDSMCCSRKCASLLRESNKTKIVKTCLICGKSVAQNTYSYCSKECVGKAKSLAGRIERSCPGCSKIFFTRKSEPTEYCSRECRSKSNRKHYKCLMCDKEFSRAASNEKYSNVSYCSVDCQRLARMTTRLDRWHNGKPCLLDSKGYVLVWQPDSNMALCTGWINEHRLIMSKKINRDLDTKEHVHHIDGNKQNNDISNLELLTHKEHAAEEAKIRAEKAQLWDSLPDEIKAQYLS